LKLVVQRGVEAATQTAAERDIKNATGSAQVPHPARRRTTTITWVSKP